VATYGVVLGVNETLATLKKMEPEMYKQSRKEVVKTAEPIIKTARSRLMDQSPKNWGNWRGGYTRGAASRGIRPQLRQERVTGFTGRRLIFRVVQNNAGGAIYDNAGSRGNYTTPTQRGVNFVDKLTRSSGYRAQRSLWPAAVKHRDEVHAAFKTAAFNMEDVINQELRSRGYSKRGAQIIARTGYA
jgi:hypothetical protein